MNVILSENVFDFKINLGHSDLYFMFQMIFHLLFFALKNILVLLAMLNSGELRCPATALIVHGIGFQVQWIVSSSWIMD